MSLNYRNFLFYKKLCEGRVTGNCPLQQKWPFLHKLSKFEKADGQIKLSLLILLDCKVIQKLYAGILEFFIFFNFTGS